MKCAMSLSVRPVLIIVLAVVGIVAVGDAQAALVGRAISAAGDLNLTTFNIDADSDGLPSEDRDFDGPGFVGPPEGFPASPGDMFGLGRRGQNSVAGTGTPHAQGDPSMDPYAFAAMDDSLSVFAGDSQGMIKAGTAGNITDSDPFFAVVDIINDDTSDGYAQVATWLFDVSGASGGLSMSIDMTAMGDFEASGTNADTYHFEVSLDGGAFSTVFLNTVDEDAQQSYTMEDGMTYMLDDPLLFEGTALDNEFQTFMKNIGTATSTLMLRFSAISDGGTEAFAFRNILIEDGGSTTILAGDYNDDGVVDAADYVLWRKNEGSVSSLPNDPDVGTVVDADQYNTWRAGFGDIESGSGGIGVVPEPASGLLMLIGLAALAGRRRA